MIKNDKTISSSLIQKLQDCTTEDGFASVFDSLNNNFEDIEIIIRFDRDEIHHFNPLKPESKTMEYNLSRIQQYNSIVEEIKSKSRDLVSFMFNFLDKKDSPVDTIKFWNKISNKTHYEIVFPVFWDREVKTPTVRRQTEGLDGRFFTNVRIGEIKIFDFKPNFENSFYSFENKMDLGQFLKTELKKKMEESIAVQLSLAVSNNQSVDNKEDFFIELSVDYRAFDNSKWACHNLNEILSGMNDIEKRMFLDWVKERFEIN